MFKKGDLVEVVHVLGDRPDGLLDLGYGIVVDVRPGFDPDDTLVMIADARAREHTEWYAWQLEMLSEK